MSAQRLGGSDRRRKDPTPRPLPNGIIQWQVNSLKEIDDAINYRYTQYFARTTPDDVRWCSACKRSMLMNHDVMHKAHAKSDAFIEEAIAVDPRLGRRGAWVRHDEGETFDVGMIAMGDDNPYFRRVRKGFTDSPLIAEPVKITISTDRTEITPDTLAAFIATARLVMQFRPLEIWWQGAWLDADANVGFVFHMPLVLNTMDWTLLQFCINSDMRDHVSFAIMMHHAIKNKLTWQDCGHAAQRGYNEPHAFVSHEGIQPYGRHICNTALEWLGWESTWSMEYEIRKRANSALQTLPEEYKPAPPKSPEQKAREDAWHKQWEREYTERQKQREKMKEQDAKERLNK